MLNTCIETGVFPNDRNETVIIPTFKKENLDPELLALYRPVSNLVFLSKFFEQLIHTQIVEHVTNFDLMDDSQSAYRTGVSTET